MKVKKWTLQILTCPPLLLQLARRLLGNKGFSVFIIISSSSTSSTIQRWHNMFEEYYWESHLSCIFKKTFLGFFFLKESKKPKVDMEAWVQQIGRAHV